MKTPAGIKILLYGCLLVAMGFVATYSAPWLLGKQLAINILANVFAILAGFLIAIVSLVGDPSMVPQGSWKLAEFHRQNAMGAIVRGKASFILFVVALIFLVAASMSPLREAGCIVDTSLGCWVWRTVDWVMLYLCQLCFLVCIHIPGSLQKLQEQRLNRLISERREADRKSQPQLQTTSYED